MADLASKPAAIPSDRGAGVILAGVAAEYALSCHPMAIRHAPDSDYGSVNVISVAIGNPPVISTAK